MQVKLVIVQPSGVFFSDMIDLVTFKAAHGFIGLKANHIPFISSIQISSLLIEIGDKKTNYAIGGGIVVCGGSGIFIITESIISAKDINLKSEILRKEKIQAMLEEKRSASEFNKLQIELNEALNRIKIKSTAQQGESTP